MRDIPNVFGVPSVSISLGDGAFHFAHARDFYPGARVSRLKIRYDTVHFAYEEPMGDRSKAEARKAEIARQFEEAKRAAPKPLVRCRGCRQSEREVAVMIEMGGFIFCDQCIELAARAVALRKPGR